MDKKNSVGRIRAGNFGFENREINNNNSTFMHFPPIKIPIKRIKLEVVQYKSHLTYSIIASRQTFIGKIKAVVFQTDESRYVHTDWTFASFGRSWLQFWSREQTSWHLKTDSPPRVERYRLKSWRKEASRAEEKCVWTSRYVKTNGTFSQFWSRIPLQGRKSMTFNRILQRNWVASDGKLREKNQVSCLGKKLDWKSIRVHVKNISGIFGLSGLQWGKGIESFQIYCSSKSRSFTNATLLERSRPVNMQKYGFD